MEGPPPTFLDWDGILDNTVLNRQNKNLSVFRVLVEKDKNEARLAEAEAFR